jgi:hypothetical protein
MTSRFRRHLFRDFFLLALKSGDRRERALARDYFDRSILLSHRIPVGAMALGWELLANMPMLLNIVCFCQEEHFEYCEPRVERQINPIIIDEVTRSEGGRSASPFRHRQADRCYCPSSATLPANLRLTVTSAKAWNVERRGTNTLT